MKLSLFIFSILFTFGTFAQTDVFKESNEAISEHFVNSDILKESAISDRYSELTRSEGFLVNDVTIMGSVFTKKLHRSGKVIFNCPAGDYLNALKSKMLEDYPDVDKLIHVYITEDPSLNAFATVNNNIYVNIGLLARVENEAQLAFILCHEIMHIVDAHIINETLKINTEAKVFNKSNVGIDDQIFQLRRHAISREHETQADLDGFTLFLKQKYDAIEGVTALEMLERANDYTIDFDLNNQLFFMPSLEEFNKLLSDYREKSNKKKEKKDEDEDELSTHPLLNDRIDQMAEILKGIDGELNDGIQFIVSEDNFKLIHAQANSRINEIYAEDLDFVSLYLNSAARMVKYGDKSDQNLNFIGYAVQGLLIDKFNTYKIGDARSTNQADSVFSFFYTDRSNENFAKWAYQVIDTLHSTHPENLNLKRYNMIITQAIVNQDGINGSAIFGEDFATIDNVKSTNINGLDIEKLTFEITPFSDMSIFKVSKFNESQKHSDTRDGKVAIIGMNMVHIRKSAPMTFDYMIDLAKTENIEQRADHVCENLEEDYPDKIISLIPNAIEYKGDEYYDYDILNQWMSERLYFNNEYYVSIHDEKVKQIIEEKDIRYIMSSVNVGIKSFSMKSFIAVYFSPFLMPIYLPQLAAHIAASSTRKYQLTLIYDIETGALAFWDKRTYLEPSLEAQLQVTYNDVLNTFFHE